jgi:hypothetical protein
LSHARIPSGCTNGGGQLRDSGAADGVEEVTASLAARTVDGQWEATESLYHELPYVMVSMPLALFMRRKREGPSFISKSSNAVLIFSHRTVRPREDTRVQELRKHWEPAAAVDAAPGTILTPALHTQYHKVEQTIIPQLEQW